MSVQFLLPNVSTTQSPLVVAVESASNADVQQLNELVTIARGLASSLATSSIIARSSESDEYEDIAIYLGSGDYSNAPNVLGALGIDKNTQVTEVPLAANSLPPGIDMDASTWTSNMDRLENKYCFRVRASDGVWLFVLVFCLGHQRWGALVGGAVWSDE
ncbi:hypothetical protein BKA70DRAFT_1558132 [Coprinopsis sp. MPI-PUGE-AT-0042]|nr:hypothetical protein BKA70DRAFT_1558132 [Coprinopsis sp. MPI-PUGE-AT-0042]